MSKLTTAENKRKSLKTLLTSEDDFDTVLTLRQARMKSPRNW